MPLPLPEEVSLEQVQSSPPDGAALLDDYLDRVHRFGRLKIGALMVSHVFLLFFVLSAGTVVVLPLGWVMWGRQAAVDEILGTVWPRLVRHPAAREAGVDGTCSSEAGGAPAQGHRALEFLFILLAIALCTHGTNMRPRGELAISRLATVYSLTHYGSFYIDAPEGQRENPFATTIDKVMVRGRRVGNGVADGRMLSSKPPLFPLIMTAEYIVLNRILGWDLDTPEDVPRIVRTMTVTLVGAAYVLTLIFFLKTLELLGIASGWRPVLLAALAFGTQLWGFSTVLNNHVPAACCLVVAAYLAQGLTMGKLAPAPWRFAVFGLACGLVPVLDMPSGAYTFLAMLAVLWKFPKRTLAWAVPMAAIPVAVHAGVMLAVTGSPLPVQLHKETYLYETSYWRHPMGIDGLSEPPGTYLFHMTFGRCGMFSLYPILIAGLAGMVRALFKRRTPRRGAVLLGAAAFAAVTYYYAFHTNNYGGEAYGFRWYIASMPVMLLIGAPLLASLKKPWQQVFVAILLAVSLYSGWECAHTGWQSSQEWTCRILGPSS